MRNYIQVILTFIIALMLGIGLGAAGWYLIDLQNESQQESEQDQQDQQQNEQQESESSSSMETMSSSSSSKQVTSSQASEQIQATLQPQDCFNVDDDIDMQNLQSGSNAQPLTVILNTPCVGSEVEEEMVLSGMGYGIWENALLFELLDSQGNVLQTGSASINAPDLGEPGLFYKEIDVNSPKQVSELRIYEKSARDGSESDVIVLPLNQKN